MRGVWDGNSGWIHAESHDNSTWEGRNTVTPLGPPDGWGSQVVQNEFSREGRQATVPGGGMPGVSATRAAMQVHFVHWHLHDTVIILEEVALLQYNHGVVDVPVHKVHPHRRLCR